MAFVTSYISKGYLSLEGKRGNLEADGLRIRPLPKIASSQQSNRNPVATIDRPFSHSSNAVCSNGRQTVATCRVNGVYLESSIPSYRSLILSLCAVHVLFGNFSYVGRGPKEKKEKEKKFGRSANPQIDRKKTNAEESLPVPI